MKYFLFIYSLPHVKWHGQPRLPLDLRTAHVELDRLPHVKWHAQHRLPLEFRTAHVELDILPHVKWHAQHRHAKNQ